MTEDSKRQQAYVLSITDTTSMIETTALSKRFGQRVAVKAVDLAVPRGCAYGFLGHNGAARRR